MKERVLDEFLLKTKRILPAIVMLVLTIGLLTEHSIITKATEGIAFTDKPDIRISRLELPPIKANEEFVLTLKLDNASPAYSVNRGKLTLSVPEGLSICDQSNIYFIDGTGIPVHGSNTVEVKLKASDKINTESFQIGITLEYTYWGREGMASGSENYNIILPAKKTGATSDEGTPVIQVVRDKIKPVKAKESYEFDIEIRNINKKVKAKNVKVTMSAGAGFSIKGRTSNHFVKEIEYDDPYVLPIKIKTMKTIETENLELTVNVSYSYDQAGAAAQGTDSEKITIPSIITDAKKEEESASTLTPNIIVSNYDYGDKVEAGSSFPLSLSFKNTSRDVSVENIVMSINTAEGISVASSSNSFYFDKLTAGGSLPLKVELKAWEEAKSAAAVLTINFSYEYRNGKNVTKGSTSESISIPVVQPDRFEIGEIENAGEALAFVGEEFYFSIPYVNKGKATTSNISAKIEGEGFDCISKEVWVGNCNSGSNGSIDIILTPLQVGDLVAKIKVEYEDANSKKKTKEIEVPFFAQEMMREEPMEPNVEDMMPEQKGNPKLKLIIIAIVTVVGLVGFIIVIRVLKKRANAKKMERLSHMYDWATGADDKQATESKTADKNGDNQGEK